MSTQKVTHPHDWQCQPKAEALVMRILEKSLDNPFISQLNDDLHQHTSTRLFDWLDHVIVGYSPHIEKELEDCGFVSFSQVPSYRAYFHPGAQLPSVIVKNEPSSLGIGVSVESIADFLMVRGMNCLIEGTIFSGFRRCLVSSEKNSECWVVERRGIRSFEPTYSTEAEIKKYLEAEEKWMTRERHFENEREGLEKTISLAKELMQLLSQDLAAWVVLDCERKYWQARNHAGQLQKSRQDRFGMGWANHDHHTFRSSRINFHLLVQLFEILGFSCRERFYAGKEAGWGAQVMENPNCRLVLFLDTDLASDELELDFAHRPLSELPSLGTIGLWCALHGDSILQAGMHHLEAQFLFDSLSGDLAHVGVQMMTPFSNFSYLRQAFTSGEIWRVDPKRVNKILKEKLITPQQAEKFISHGAIGSHLENLQRREGYKGFNKNNVSLIIKQTDPRGSTP